MIEVVIVVGLTLGVIMYVKRYSLRSVSGQGIKTAILARCYSKVLPCGRI